MNSSAVQLKKTAPESGGRKQGFFGTLNKHKYYYLLMLPGILYFIVFKYIPMGGVILAFKNYRFVDGILGSPWAGWKWFEQLFWGGDFLLILRNTLVIGFMKLIFNFPAPILLALFLNEVRNRIFKRTVQTIVYLPHFISWVIIGGLMVTLLSPSTGILSLIGVKTSPLMQPEHFRGVLVWSAMWKEAGWGTVVYLAAISGINPEMYEAALIDGAGRFQQMRYITVPSIMNTIVILLILRTGQILHAGFDQIYVLYSPLVYDVADVIDTYVYRTGITQGRFSYATAAGLFESVVGLVMVVFTNYIARKINDEGLW